MLDVILDSLLDTVKILPFLLVAFLVLEFVEHKLTKKNEKLLDKKKKLGPIFGGILGALPQCGFSTMAANLFSNRVITIGTLVAIFLATSDEMLPIMLSESASWTLMLGIVVSKMTIGIVVGLIVDLVLRGKNDGEVKQIENMCHEECCGCEENGIFWSSVKHTLKIGGFVLIANLLISIAIFGIGEDNLMNFLVAKNMLTYFIAGIVGLIPNCASSVIITKLFLEGVITIGTLFAGLLVGSGLGVLVLFKTNKSLKENLIIMGIVYAVGVVVGVLVDFLVVG